MSSNKALESEVITDLVKDSELEPQGEESRTFVYNMSDKAAKNKLIKGAKRPPFEMVENTASYTLMFSIGAWNHVVLPSIKYWNQVKGTRSCKLDSMEVNIASIEMGKEAGGRHMDTLVVFYANRDKVVCHLYNTTQRILVNGHGYGNFTKKFLKPFFESKLSFNLEDIARYNKHC